MNDKLIRKINRKIKHYESVLLKYENIKPSEKPTRTIFVGNGGLGCGIQSELLIDIFSVYGIVQNVLMLPDKPYSFIVYKNEEDALNGFNDINGQTLKSGHIFYLSYINDFDLPQKYDIQNVWPNGLVYIENFISEVEEEEFLSAVNFEESDDSTSLKFRKVKHYGYEFFYGKNNINKDKPLDSKIPEIFLPHLRKLVFLGYLSKIPDQLTVNRYLPGQGIPPHIDTHSAFEDGIISISLGSQAVMDFTHPSKERVSVLVSRRSALIMKGESRYLWKHGITPRKTDIVQVNNSVLTLCHRGIRTSLTFRLINQGDCKCEYPEQCDSQIKSISSKDLVDENEAEELERKFVSQVYENIAGHFSDTRYKPWPKVWSFLNAIQPGSLILDVGCGNGKNMGLSNSCFEIGCDASIKLAEVCSCRDLQVLVADCLKLPFRSGCADVVICIAVIHHLSTKVRRSKAIKEILRVLHYGGKSLVYVWAFEQETTEGSSNYLKLGKVSSKMTTDTKESAEVVLTDCSSGPKIIQMPIHKNRTNFIEQDMLVPWKEKKTCQGNSLDNENRVHHRYYHVFSEGELETLITENGGHILSSYYDKGNWCVLFQK